MMRLILLLVALALPAAAGDKPGRAGAMAIGLSGVFDWSVQQPFLDVMKTARPWLGHMHGAWGGMTTADLRAAGLLDENGWPVRIPVDLRAFGTIVLTDLPPEAVSLAGRYRVSFDGKGVLEVGGRAKNVRYNRHGATFDFTPGGGGVTLSIERTDRADPIRNIRVVHTRHEERLAAGEVFNPDWTARIRPFGAVRFMDWMETNNSTQSDWQDRPRVGDATWAEQGVPVEIMMALANEYAFDPWFNMPHLATDDYLHRFAETVRDSLDPALTIYVEFSNEVWNWQFEQARWAEAQGIERWGQQYSGWQYYGMRAAQMAQIWREVFAAEPDRLVTVISTQTGWLGREPEVLEAPLWVAEDPAHRPPAEYFDAYAVTGYFSARLGYEDKAGLVRDWLEESRQAARTEADGLGLTGTKRLAHVEAHRYDEAVRLAARELRTGEISGDPRDTLLQLFNETLTHHKAAADAHGLTLVMYEGGTHVVGIGPMVEDPELVEFFTHLNYSSAMGQLYEELLQGWQASGGTLFNVFADVYRPNRWGSWGALRHLDDDNPRWQALTAAAAPGQ